MIISFFCYYNRVGRRRRDPSLSVNETVEQSQQEPSSLLDPYQSQPGRFPSPPSRSRLYIDTICRWKSFRHGLPSYSNTQASSPPPPTTTAAAAATRTMPPIEQPPAYEGKPVRALVGADHYSLSFISNRFVSERNFADKSFFKFESLRHFSNENIAFHFCIVLLRIRFFLLIVYKFLVNHVPRFDIWDYRIICSSPSRPLARSFALFLNQLFSLYFVLVFSVSRVLPDQRQCLSRRPSDIMN